MSQSDLPQPLKYGCEARWHWSQRHKSPEVLLYGRTALFHPNWSHGTAAVRGSRQLNGGVHYWEVQVSQRLFGTAVMFGICTASARLHADTFVSLVGEDRNGWGLSHKGLVWHAGKSHRFTYPFRENRATTVGVLFDGQQGTLGFYKDARWLGVAFTGLDTITEPLYPVIASTAAKTELSLGVSKRAWGGLQDRARHTLLATLPNPKLIHDLPLPPALKRYLEDDLPPTDSVTVPPQLPTEHFFSTREDTEMPSPSYSLLRDLSVVRRHKRAVMCQLMLHISGSDSRNDAQHSTALQ